jgi:hypothetical protein
MFQKRKERSLRRRDRKSWGVYTVATKAPAAHYTVETPAASSKARTKN